MSILIRDIAPHDVPAMIMLAREFAAFENLSEYCDITEERLHRAMFEGHAVVEGLIAFDGTKPIGYALFYPNFSSFRGHRGLYLEDIYINSDHRGKGLGEAMLREIARRAISRGYERIDFLVLNWNESAVRFYEKLGAVRDKDERHFKFTDEAFRRLSEPPA